MNTTELKEFSELAQAAYAHFLPIDYVHDQNTVNRLKTYEDMLNGTFSEQQARLFTQRYSVLNQSTEDTISGFSATVFQDKSDPNRLVLSFRGTEFEGDKLRDLFLTDLDIGINGYARPQAIALYRYIRQLQTAAGEQGPMGSGSIEILSL